MRLLVVDDHEVLRRGVRSLLEDQPGYEVCGEAADGQEAVEKARELKPDVIVMDISMPRLSGLEATSLIRSSLPDSEVVLLSQHNAPEMARQALKAGARGYVIKTSMARDLIAAVERVSRGEYSYDPSFSGLTTRTANSDVQEIIERSAALEQALRESERLYRSTFEIAGVGVSHVAPDGRWLRVNRKLCEIVGYSEEELLKLTFQQMTHPDDLPADLELTQKILNGELDTFSMEKRYIRKDGSPIWINLTAAAVRHADRKLKHFVSVVEDISQRKEFEATLRDWEERLRLAQQAAHVGTFEWNIQTGLNQWTPELEIMHGLNPGTFQGTYEAWAQLVHPEDREEVLRKVEGAIREENFEGEWRVVWPDGSIHWVLARGSVLKDQNRKPLRMLGVNIDITERKQAEDALRRSEAGYRVLSNRLESLRAQAEGERSKLYEVFMKAPAAIALLAGAEHRFTFINSEGLRMSRRKRVEELIGKTTREAMPELAGQGYFELLDGVYRTGVPFVGNEMPVRLQGGSDDANEQVFMNFVFEPLRNAAGEVDGVMYHGVEITQQVRARKMIADSEERFRLAEAAAQVGSWEWDPVSGARKLSPELQRILAVDTSDDGVKKWAERIHADDRLKVENLMKESSRTGEMDFDYRYHHPDLGLRWLHSKGRRFGDESRMFGVVQDVTERKQEQAALQQSEEHLRAIVETTPECVLLVNSQGRLLHMNAAGLKMFGESSAETIVGKSIYEFIAAEDRERFREFNQKICSNEKASLEFEILGLEGRRRRVESHGAPLHQPDGSCIQLAVMRDVTDRMLAGQATALLAAIVDSSDDAIVSKNLDGVITSWNKGAERIFGYTAAEAAGQHITLIIPEDRREEEVGILRKLRNGQRIDHFETVRKHKDGTLLDISVTISPVKDESGRIIGASKVARDIGHRKRAEADLRRSEEQLRKLSETLDAEVRARTRELEDRNAEISLQAQQLRELSWSVARAQEEERRHVARELHDSAGQTLTVLSINAAQLVDEAEGSAPDLAKRGRELQALIQQLHREVRTASYLLHPPLLDEAGLVSALNWYVQGLMERSGLSITLDISDDFGRLPGDMELVIFRLVQECLTNIHRHSGSKTAAIQIFNDGENVRVQVKDDGIGIPPQLLAKVQTGGSGVGIRGMQERLRQFRGAMEIVSNGSGTSVIARIPVEKYLDQQSTRKPSHMGV